MQERKRKPGAGRKRGGKNSRKVGAFRVRSEAALSLTADGMLPLEVMLTVMRKHLEAARDAQDGGLAEYDKAAAIAKDAAPFIHPRLAQANITPEKEKIIVVRGGFKDDAPPE